MTIAPVVTPEKKRATRNVSKEALAKVPAQVTEKQTRPHLDKSLSPEMVGQIPEEQRKDGGGNRIDGHYAGGITGSDSEPRGEQWQQRGNHLIVDFAEKSNAEKQQQDECRASWIRCHSVNQGQKGR